MAPVAGVAPFSFHGFAQPAPEMPGVAAAAFAKPAGGRPARWGADSASNLRRYQAAQRYAERQLHKAGLAVSDETLVMMIDVFCDQRAIQPDNMPPAAPPAAPSSNTGPLVMEWGIDPEDMQDRFQRAAALQATDIHAFAEFQRSVDWIDAGHVTPMPPVTEIAVDEQGAIGPGGPARAVFRHDGSAEQACFMDRARATHAKLLSVSQTYREQMEMASTAGPVHFVISTSIPHAACTADDQFRNLVMLNPDGLRSADQCLEKALSFEVGNASHARHFASVRALLKLDAFDTGESRTRDQLHGAARLLARGPADSGATGFAVAIEEIEWMTALVADLVSGEHDIAGLGRFPKTSHRPAWLDRLEQAGPGGSLAEDVSCAVQAMGGHSQHYVSSYRSAEEMLNLPAAEASMMVEADTIRALPVFQADEREIAEQATRAIYTSDYALPDLLGAALMTDIRHVLITSEDEAERNEVLSGRGTVDAAGLNRFEQDAVARALQLTAQSPDPDQSRMMLAVVQDMFPLYS